MVLLAEILWQPFFPPVAILSGAAAIVLLCLWSYARSLRQRPALATGLAAMRILLVAVIATVLMGPSRLPEQDLQQARSTLHVLVDTSASMQTPDADGRPRLTFAVEQWLSGDAAAALAAEHEIKLMAYDASPRPALAQALARPVEQVAVGPSTSLGESLHHALDGLPQGGDGSAILVLGDGRDTVEQPMAPLGARARARSLPIYTVTLGGPQFGRDVAVTAMPQQEYLLAGEEGQLLVTVLQNNDEPLESQLSLRCGDWTDQRPLDLAVGNSLTVPVPIRHAEPGLYEYEVSVLPVADEVEERNNSTRVFVEVTAARFKVLLLEGQPYWDTKYLAQSLRKDDRIELTQITHVTPDRQQRVVTRTEEQSAVVPQSLEDWATYDVVVLGRSLEGLLDADTAAQLPQYVSQRGGRVIFVRGQAYDPATPDGREMGRILAPIEPVVWGRGALHDQTLALSPLGRVHPSFTSLSPGRAPESLLAMLPKLLAVPVVQREKVGASVLAVAQSAGAAASTEGGQPALLAMPYGRGMVVAFIGEGLWRWNLQARQQPELDGVFDAFWSNMIRWAVMDSQFTPGRDLSLRLSKRSVQVGQELRLDVVSRLGRQQEAPGTMTVIDPDGAEHVVALAARENSRLRFDGRFSTDRPGVHRVLLKPSDPDEPAVETCFYAYDVNLERLMSAANPQAMLELAEASGGAALDPLRPEALREVLAKQRAAMLVPPRPRFIWDSGWAMMALLGWAGAEWLGRKRGGLV